MTTGEIAILNTMRYHDIGNQILTSYENFISNCVEVQISDMYGLKLGLA